MKTVFFLFFLQITGLLAVAQINIRKLSTEYLSNPIGIDPEKPRFSWIIESKERDVQQLAYQIFVASSAEKTGKGLADIWDSGKILSGKSVLIPFEGRPLSSKKRYYWTVCIWDQKGRSISSHEIAFWEMGLLTKRDWAGKWISAPKVYDWKNFNMHRRLLICLLYTSPSPRDRQKSRMPSSA